MNRYEAYTNKQTNKRKRQEFFKTNKLIRKKSEKDGGLHKQTEMQEVSKTNILIRRNMKRKKA